jgi:hypothetical protein
MRLAISSQEGFHPQVGGGDLVRDGGKTDDRQDVSAWLLDRFKLKGIKKVRRSLARFSYPLGSAVSSGTSFSGCEEHAGSSSFCNFEDIIPVSLSLCSRKAFQPLLGHAIQRHPGRIGRFAKTPSIGFQKPV